MTRTVLGHENALATAPPVTSVVVTMLAPGEDEQDVEHRGGAPVLRDGSEIETAVHRRAKLPRVVLRALVGASKGQCEPR